MKLNSWSPISTSVDLNINGPLLRLIIVFGAEWIVLSVKKVRVLHAQVSIVTNTATLYMFTIRWRK